MSSEHTSGRESKGVALSPFLRLSNEGAIRCRRYDSAMSLCALENETTRAASRNAFSDQVRTSGSDRMYPLLNVFPRLIKQTLSLLFERQVKVREKSGFAFRFLWEWYIESNPLERNCAST